jgi:hypothetical protein
LDVLVLSDGSPLGRIEETDRHYIREEPAAPDQRLSTDTTSERNQQPQTRDYQQILHQRGTSSPRPEIINRHNIREEPAACWFLSDVVSVDNLWSGAAGSSLMLCLLIISGLGLLVPL